jgi:hypothetical protein
VVESGCGARVPHDAEDRRQMCGAVPCRELGRLAGPLVPAPLNAKPSCAGPMRQGRSFAQAAPHRRADRRGKSASQWPPSAASSNGWGSIGFPLSSRPSRSVAMNAPPWRDHPHRHQKAWQVQSNRPPYHRRPHQGLPGEEPFAVDFVKHAEAMGALTRHVESLTDLGQALDWAKATDRTTVITVVSDACTWTPGDAWWDVGVPQNERSRQGGHCRYSLAGRRTRQRLTFYLGGSPRTDSHTGQMGASKSLRRLESQKLHPLSSVSAMPRLACLR